MPAPHQSSSARTLATTIGAVTAFFVFLGAALPAVLRIPATQLAAPLALAGGLACLAGLICRALTVRKIQSLLDPLHQLADAAQRAAEDRTFRSKIEALDGEFGRIAASFNRLMEQAGERDAELASAKETLEQRVAERTHSLEAARNEVAREKERFQFIFDYLPVGISLHTVENGVWREILINDAVLRISGVQRDQLSDPGVFRKVSHPEDLARQDELIRQLDAGEIDHFSFEKRFLRPDGSVVWAAVSVQRKHYPGNLTETLWSLVDITGRKNAQAGIALERERLKFIFDHIPIGVSLQSLKNGVWQGCLYNEAHLKICGITREQADEPEIFRHLTPPEDYEKQLALAEKLDRREVDSFSLEKRYIRPNGTTVWVLFSAQRKDYPDGRTENLCTVVDITERKKAQEEIALERARFKFIFESVPVGIAWTLNNQMEMRIVNPAHAAITNVPAAQCHDVRSYESATHPDDWAVQAEYMRKLASGEIDHYHMEKRYRRPEGGWRWAFLTVNMLASSNGEVQELTTVVDIDDRKRAAQELEDIHRQLLDTSRRAGMAEVATAVLHNVGNVLNSVNVSATLVADQVKRSKASGISKIRDLFLQHKHDLSEFLASDPRGKVVPEYLSSLAEELAREQTSLLAELDNLRKNINHIKDIVSMQQDYAKTSGVRETISVPDLIEDALRMNDGSLSRHDIEVVREYHARPVITLEKNKALQILINLVRNAKYACDESGRPDKILTITTTADEQHVRIAVQDNGVGIAPENLTRIFAHGFTTRSDGHGFGLHSSALAAKEMGGSLTVKSGGLGTGATFTLELPFKPVQARS